MRDTVLGLIAGAMGALVWAAVAYFSDYEIGWIAWGIGALVGYAVARGGEEGARSPMVAGCLAALITALSIVVGKYGAVVVVMPDDAGIIAFYTERFDDEEYVMSFLADEVVLEFLSTGRARGMAWPEGVDPANAATQADYPVEVWAEVDKRWAALSDDEQTIFREQKESLVRQDVAANLPTARDRMRHDAFFSAFGLLDVVFFGLAMVTAFGMAANREQSVPDTTDTIGRTSA